MAFRKERKSFAIFENRRLLLENNSQPSKIGVSYQIESKISLAQKEIKKKKQGKRTINQAQFLIIVFHYHVYWIIQYVWKVKIFYFWIIEFVVGWLFYGISTLFGSFNVELNFKQFSLV